MKWKAIFINIVKFIIFRIKLSSTLSLSCSVGHQALTSQTLISEVMVELMHLPVATPYYSNYSNILKNII
jgi:hypothetical protein